MSKGPGAILRILAATGIALLLLAGCEPVPDAGEESAEQSNVTVPKHELDEYEGEEGESTERVNLSTEKPFSFDNFMPGTSFRIGDSEEAVREALGEPCEVRDASSSSPIMISQVRVVDRVEQWRYWEDCGDPPTRSQPEYIAVNLIVPRKLVHSISVYTTLNGEGLAEAEFPKVGKVAGRDYDEVRKEAQMPDSKSTQEIRQYNWTNYYFHHQIQLENGKVTGTTSIVVDNETNKIVALKTEAFASPGDILDLIKAATGERLHYEDVD